MSRSSASAGRALGRGGRRRLTCRDGHRDGFPRRGRFAFLGLGEVGGRRALPLELAHVVAVREARGHARLLLDLARPVEVALAARVEPGRDDRDLEVVAHALVDDRAEDDVRLLVGHLADDLRRLVDLEEAEARTAGDVEQDALRARDVDLEQRAADRLARGLGGAVGPARAADAHEGRPGGAHDGADVREVEVDQPGHRDQVADALDALAEDVVDDAEGVDDRGLGADDVLEAVVRDRDERVDLVAEQLRRLLRVQPAPGALPAEGLRDDADREGAQVAGDLGDDRGRARSGATTHAGRDEDHVRVAQRVGDLLRVLLGGALADAGVAAGAEAAGDLVPDADLVRRIGLEEGLRVRVDRDELDAHQLGADHPVDGVAASTAHADDADEREVL